MPFEISVAADTGYMNATLISFSIVAVITAVIFAAVLVSYTGFLNRRFFNPMVSVIGSITELQTDAPSESLPHVQSEEFDNLIDKINEMLGHIETKNAEVTAAEVGRQKALVVSLQKQINAHFTVNTLEALRANVEQKEFEKAEVLMSGLTRIFLYAHSKEEEINIWEESEILKYYVSIMSGRYGGKIRMELDFDEDLMETNMPRMLIQPLIENSVEHGFKDMDSGCIIKLKAELRGGVIRFTVSDNGYGMDEPELSELKEQLRAAPGSLDGLNNIALLNIRNRLHYYYGEAARMEISSSVGSGFEVMFEIPAPAKKEGAV
jgi:sensor histidine kinase YesM